MRGHSVGLSSNMRWIEWAFWAVAIAILTVLIVVLTSCTHPAPPSPTPIGPLTLSVCSKDMALPTAADVCDGYYTAEGFSCVNCLGASGCFESADSVYCVVGNCTSDQRCQYSTGAAAQRGKK